MVTEMNEQTELSSTIAAYDATADIYASTIGTAISAEIEGPLDRALLSLFVELVAPSERLVADIGCGPGRVAAFLAARGLPVVGIDPSAGMLAVAAAAHPGLRFEIGNLTDLPLADASLAGAVCWYSIIHTPPARLATSFHELARALAPGGRLLLAFQSGRGEAVHRDSVHGRSVSLTNYRHDPDEIADLLGSVGLPVDTRAEREADGRETTPQAFLLAQRSSAPLPKVGDEVR